MKYLAVSTEALKQAAEVLCNGGLVAFPTETVYGLGADAFNPQALAKIFDVKNRPHFDPLIVHIAAIETLEDVTNLSLLNAETKEKLFLLVQKFWPGPLSLILPKNDKIPGIATAGLSTVAIRFPDNECAQKLISLSTGAVAAPSANPFGAISPTKADHVRDGLGEKVDIILDGGCARIGLESTVLDITGDNIKILRPGGTPKEAIENIIGSINDNTIEDSVSIENTACGLTSPGLLKSHYAPKTPLTVHKQDDIINQPYETGVAFLFFDGFTRNAWLKTQKPADSAIIMVLSETGQVQEAAFRLFETLHILDNEKITHIFAQLAPQHGLGEAINDRLIRASS